VYQRPHIDRRWLAAFSTAIALVCIVVLSFQVRDRWQPPEIKSTAQAEHSTTGRAARSAGARLSPTDPSLAVEPKPDGPKQAQPAQPD
jgi:hypothetical protein